MVLMRLNLMWSLCHMLPGHRGTQQWISGCPVLRPRLLWRWSLWGPSVPMSAALDLGASALLRTLRLVYNVGSEVLWGSWLLLPGALDQHQA